MAVSHLLSGRIASPDDVIAALHARTRSLEDCLRAMVSAQLAQDQRITELEADLQVTTPQHRLAAQVEMERWSSLLESNGRSA